MKAFSEHIILRSRRVFKNYLLHGCYWALSIVLIGAGLGKMMHPNAFFETLEAFSAPLLLQVPIVALLPMIEIIVGLALLLRWRPVLFIPVLALLYMFFWAISLYGLWIGLKMDCACFGNSIQSTFGWGMVIRNTLFLIASGWLWINKKDLFVFSE